MKTRLLTNSLKALIALMVIMAGFTSVSAKEKNKYKDEDLFTYRGKVVDEATAEPLMFATLSVEGTAISTVANSEGEYILKVPKDGSATQITVTYIGYETLKLDIKTLKQEKEVIRLKSITVQLSDINVMPKDAELIIRAALENKRENYQNETQVMRAFYRETIRKKNTYVSLSEAVVDVLKYPYNSMRNDQVQLLKGRKSSDASKTDTLVFKLQGGPYTNLMLDIVKDPYMFLDEKMMEAYQFEYKSMTRVDGRLTYIISFKQRPYVTQPLFYGQFYIDVDKLAINSVVFSLNLDNINEAADFFIKKKPFNANVIPTKADYMINYKERDGKYYFNYSRCEVGFKVDWKRKIFHSYYNSVIEMAATNWESSQVNKFAASDRLRLNVIMQDHIQGFADKDFWGDANIIEPEKSIESAIKKINKKLNKM